MALAGVSTGVALLGAAVAWAEHRAKTLERAALPQPLFNLFWGRYKVDELYGAIFQTGGKSLGVWLWQIFDARVLDGLVNGTATVVGGLGDGFRRWNSGYVRSYAFSILMGVVIVVGYLMYYALSRPVGASVAGVLGKGGF